MISSAYVHIPFCRRRCYYCDFPISVLGDRAVTTTSAAVTEYVEILREEIKKSAKDSQGKNLQTVFFGGGTPSLLPVSYFAEILETLDKHFGIAAGAEISIEIDPGTFDLDRLQGYQQAGVNRVSLGVQAFQDELLQVCGRSHSVADIMAAIDLVRQVDIANFSIDLISGLPHQTLEQWQDSLLKAIQIAPQHISCYDLVLESVTAFGKQYQPGERPLPSDEMTAKMYVLASKMLREAGYEHYEISNYARSSYQCRHNRVYWQNQPYYGFGMGAASYVGGRRFTRPRKRSEYYAWVKAGAIINEPKISETDFLLEKLMLGLRLAEGIATQEIMQQFGERVLEQIWDCLRPYYEKGWVELVSAQGIIIDRSDSLELRLSESWRLSDPEGFLFSNTILASLFQILAIIDRQHP